MNSDLYLKTLKALQKRFRRVRSQKKVAAILFPSRQHTSLKTQETITKIGWSVFPQPPYSPELTPSHFRLFRAHRDTIRGERFGSDGEVIADVKLLRTRLKLLQEEDNAPVSRWRKAFKVDVDYV